MKNEKIQEFISTLQTMANELNEEEVAEQTQPVELAAESAEEAASVMPYAEESEFDPSEELHCYKSFELPDNITVHSDILKKSTATVFDYFRGISSLVGLKLMHVYKPNNVNGALGNGFSLSINEKLITENDEKYYVDGLGDKYKIYGGYAAGMKYSEEAPTFVKGYQDIKLWLNNGTCAKGFNSNGYLVVICDEDNNYIQISYDEKNNISTINLEKIKKNNDEKIYIDEYNFTYSSSGYLSKIAESSNVKSVSFTYDNGNLTQMAYSDGRILTFSYNKNLTTITSSDGYIHKISSSVSSVNITSQSSVNKVPAGEESTSLPYILSWNIILRNNMARIKDIDENSEYYKFTDGGMVSEYCKEEHSVVTYAEKREYVYDESTDYPKHKTTVSIAPESLLNKLPYSSFNYVVSPTDEQIYTVYDVYNHLDMEWHKNICLSMGKISELINPTYKSYVRSCLYDEDNLVTVEDIEFCLYELFNGQPLCQEYFPYKIEYDYSEKKLKRRRSYFIEELSKKGMDVEEYEHNDAGQVTKIISYNSLDKTKVFITEKTYDKYGNVISETDPTGLKTLKYGYIGSVTKPYFTFFPNGSTKYHLFDERYRTNKVELFNGGEKLSSTNEINYANDEAVKYINETDTINFGYDGQRQLNNVSFTVDDTANKEKTLDTTKNEKTVKYCDISYNIRDNNGNLLNTQSVMVTNAKGETFTCEENKNHTYTTIKYGNDTELKTTYLYRKYINTEIDSVSEETVKYVYDKVNKLSGYNLLSKDGEEIYSAKFDYDLDGRIGRIIQSGKTDITYDYWYQEGYFGNLERITVAEIINVFEKSDKLNRYTGRQVTYRNGKVLSESIEYKQSDKMSITDFDKETRTVYRQSVLPCKITYADGKAINYLYDDIGNITKIVNENGKQILYTYDKLNRLIREDNEEFKYSYYFKYDNKGNIKVKEKLPFTTDYYHHEIAETSVYTYQNGRITSAGDGLYIGYDELGNPILYRGMIMKWQKGKQLMSYGGLTFKYDGRGRRIKKGNTRYYYDYNDRLIVCCNESDESNKMQFFYDNIGVAGFKYNGAFYYYQRDIQNNVTAILDSNGTQVVKYVYDAWGNHIISGSNTALGKLNPFRYRSYFYDTEMGLYYLKTRYYDPTIGRFINMDSVMYADPETINGLNLYAYCNNNPVNNIDPDGHFVSTILGAIFGGIWGAITSAVQGKNVWKGMLVGAGTGAAAGFAVDFGMATGGIGGLVIAAAGGAIAGFIGDVASQRYVDGRSWNEVDIGHAFAVAGITAITNVLGYGISIAAKGLGLAMPEGLNWFQSMVTSLNPAYTPIGSWIGQGVLGFGISLLPSLYGFKYEYRGPVDFICSYI